MSNQPSRFRTLAERRRYYREQFLDRYFPPEAEGKPSPLLTIILILAAFTCLFICGVLILIPLQWLYNWVTH